MLTMLFFIIGVNKEILYYHYHYISLNHVKIDVNNIILNIIGIISFLFNYLIKLFYLIFKKT